jgi:uncharacterized membrane protein YczE
MRRPPFISPFPAERRLHRFVQLYAGLILYGLSTSLMVRADLGLSPWDVLHQGVGAQTALTIGQATVAVSGIVLLLWLPLRQGMGVGTVSNAIVIGVAVDLFLAVIPRVGTIAARSGLLVSGVVLNGIATGVYVGAGLGPGPRDGLMTGLAARGRSIRVVRTTIEVSVLLLGAALGGTVGIGTALYALAIGPIAHLTIPAFTVRSSIKRRM